MIRETDGSNNENNEHVILGNLFLQQYLAWFDYDFRTDPKAVGVTQS